MAKKGFISGDGSLIIENNLNSTSRINVPEHFKEYLRVLGGIRFKDFNFSKEAINVVFEKEINIDNILHRFPNSKDIEFKITNQFIKLSTITDKKENEDNKKIENKTINEQLEPENDSADITPPVIEENTSSEEDTYSIIELDDKIHDIEPGKYKIIFDNNKFQWALAVLPNKKRISIKESGEIWEFPDGVKTLTPISNKKKK